MQEDLAKLKSELESVLEGLGASQCQLTPVLHPQKWSIQQNVEHLLLTFSSTTDLLRLRMEKGRPTLAKRSFQQRAGQFYLITLGQFPAGRLAPAAVSPGSLAPALDSVALGVRLKESLVALSAAIASASKSFGEKRCASHLVLGPLSARQWTRFHLVHGRHHIKQIGRIRLDHRV